MRNPVASLLFAVMACCIALPAQSPVTTYHDDAMNLDFAYPSTFAGPKGEAEPPKREGDKSAEASADCVSVPIAVMDMRTDFNMIFLKRYRQSCLKTSVTSTVLGTTAANVLADTLGQLGKPTVTAAINYDLAGHGAAMVSGATKVSNASGKSKVFGVASCVIAGDDIACFQFLSNDCPTLSRLTASTAKFKDSVAVPVIPATFSSGCKP